jgi:septal ring factor EnvC (AmiA/AmiB activator)
MFVLHFITTIDCNRTLSPSTQHEALKTDLEGSRQEIDRLSSELEQSRQQSHDLESQLTEKESMVADLKQQQKDMIQQHEEDLQELEDKTQLLQEAMQEQTALNGKVTSFLTHTNRCPLLHAHIL